MLRPCLDKTLFFIFSTAAFIFYAVPSISIYTHGFIGFVLIIFLSILVGFLEESHKTIVINIKIGLKNNSFLFFISLWYAFGVIGNVLLRGNGFDDWRLMMGPFVFLMSLIYLFAFLHDNCCYRKFQIAFIIIWGIQSVFTFKFIYSDTSVLRQIVSVGPSIYGDQGGFAMIAMILPLLLWRSLKEMGSLKLLLLFFCVVLFFTVAISSFATPLGLIFLSIILIFSLLIVFPVCNRGRATSLLLGSIICLTGLLAFTFTQDSPYLASAYYRLGNFISDPTTGGYSRGDLEGSRWYLAANSLGSFQEKPFFGMGGGSIRTSKFVGGHSSAFDSLGGYGLLGGGGAFCGMFIFLLIAAFKRLLRERSWETLLGVVSFILLIVGGISNPYWEGVQPFCVLLMARPLLILSSVRKKNPN